MPNHDSVASSAFKKARELTSAAARPGGAEYLRKKVPAAVSRRLTRNRRRVRDRFVTTYGEPSSGGLVARYFRAPDQWFYPAEAPGLAPCTAHYLRGEFDLLGSGWVDARLGAESPGFLGTRYVPAKRPPYRINRANRERSEALAALLPPGYDRLDWQRDLRSGYRWPETSHSSEIEIGRAKAADIKVPWELGKLQHFPQLALAYGAAKNGTPGFEPKESYLNAFQWQLIDFVAANPPGFGVQWLTAMMAAIRGANIMIAYDLFRAAGADFEAEMHGLVRDTAYAHARAVVENLEWWDFDVRNNHYLTNLAGLMIIAAYLPCSPEVSAWRHLAAGELVREFDFQFEPDGSNFEGASAYHGFALDTMTWGLVFAGRTPRCDDRPSAEVLSQLPATVKNRVGARPDASPAGYHALTEDPARHAKWVAACRFLDDLTDPSGHLVQIGDNDSGRFISLAPVMSESATREDMLDYGPVTSAARALVGTATEQTVASRAIYMLTDGRGSSIAAELVGGQPQDSASELDRWFERAAKSGGRTTMISFDVPVPKKGIHWESRHYPDFGVYVYRRADVLLTVRCGPEENRSDGGHEHDDQGSLTLAVGDRTLVRDPGTFVYTADASWRNRMRGRSAHFAPTRDGSIGAALESEAFAPIVRGAAKVRVWSRAGLVIELDAGEGPLFRIVRIGRESIEVVDFAESGPAPVNLSKRLSQVEAHPWSAGYGRLIRP